MGKARTALKSLVDYARKHNVLGLYDHVVSPLPFDEELGYGELKCDKITLIYTPTTDDGAAFTTAGQLPAASFFTVELGVILPAALNENIEDKVYQMIDLKEEVEQAFDKTKGAQLPINHQGGLSQLQIGRCNYSYDPDTMDYTALLPMRLFYTNI